MPEFFTKSFILKNLLLLCTLILFWSLSLSAQKIDSIDWNRTYGGSGSDMAHDVIQNSLGDLIMVGELTVDDKQGCVFILDKEGNIKKKKLFGGKRDNSLHAVIEGVDGHLYAAGYTETKTKGAKDGWLVKMTMEGEKVWEKNYGSVADDEFSDLVQTMDGNLILVGYKSIHSSKQDTWIVKVDPAKKGKIIWEKKYGGGSIDQTAAVKELFSGDLVMTGVSKSEDARNADIWLLRTDKDGTTVWHKYFGGKEWDEPYDLVITREDQFAIFGFTRSKGNGKQDMWLITTDNQGNVLKDITYGNSNDDMGNAILETYNGEFLMAGTTYSWSGSAVTTQIQLLKADTAGVQIDKNNPVYVGGRKNEFASKMVQLFDGSVVMVGRTDFKAKDQKGIWALKVKTEGLPITKFIPKIVASNYEFIDENRNGLLDADESALVSLDVKNEGTGMCYNLRAEIVGEIDDEVIQYSKFIYLGSLKPGASRKLGIPITSLEDLAGTSVDFEIKFSDAGKNEIDPYPFMVISETPILSVREHSFSAADNGEIDRGKTVELNLKLKNIGRKPGEKIEVKFLTPIGVTALSDTILFKESMGRKEEWDLDFSFEINKFFPKEEVFINCVVTENGSNRYGTEQAVSIKLKEPPVKVSKLLNVYWESPAITHANKEKVTTVSKQSYSFEVMASSDADLAREDFSILLNGTRVDGILEKEYESDASFTEGDEGDILYSRFYGNTVQLIPGMNRLEINVRNAAGQKKTMPHLVRYAPPKPDLYILAIAPYSWELEYNRQDAEEFAALFKKQQGTLFGKVKTYVHTDDKITGNFEASADRIKQSFQSLLGYNDIKATDYIIVYYSGHGRTDKATYKLIGSGYEEEKPNNNIVDFGSQILPILRDAPCPKLIIMDVSKIGESDKGIDPVEKQKGSSIYSNAALIKLLAEEGEIASVVSCSSNQVSYEDKVWGGSAMMKVIKEAVNTPGLTVGDLSQLLVNKVPEVVSIRNKRIAPSVLAIQKPIVSDVARTSKQVISVRNK